MTSYDYFEALKNAAKTMVRVRTPRHLMKMITRFIDREVGLKHTTIIAFDTDYNRYLIIDSKGNKRIPAGLIRLDGDNGLVQWFLSRSRGDKLGKDFLKYKQMEALLSDETIQKKYPGLKERLLKVKKNMDVFKAAVAVPGYFKGDLVGILLLGDKLNGEDFTTEELTFFETLASDAAMTIKRVEFENDLKRRYAELQEKYQEINEMRKKERVTFKQFIMSMAQGVYEKDSYTYGHLAEVEQLGIATAEELGMKLDQKARDKMGAALRLHDLGKMFIPDEILLKPAKLTDEEYTIMKTHAARGAAILDRIDEFKDVARAVRYHHEKYDGSGYPEGIKGEEIPIGARIISVVDAFHAMVSDRCYHKGIPLEDALDELRRCAGGHFDPKVVEAFIRCLDRPSIAANIKHLRRRNKTEKKVNK